ncbi:cytochrome P450 [Sinomonas atrocyanea]|jgi:cytochrome P450|uniref:cytochrome P450 n=1 Tax=Sinomonas atrocyanea TaxID=37927 RepID=UPI00277D9000|nr:cytochrome P450 [Sinomonas atrocyanea]MDQ0259575.1 cytochrome P450 [Sinomonas atrocyanea]MDR6623166.1 cytochrome P450 [Sinomonas atrocyanea]
MSLVSELPARFDPFPLYRELREDSPVLFDAAQGVWHLFRYDDVQRALSEHAVFSSRMRGGREPDQDHLFASSLISTDPPRHRQLRSLVSEAFTPRAVAALEPRISEIVEELLDRVGATGSMDLIDDFAYPLPVIVIAELMGIPAEDRDRFKRWSDTVVSQVRDYEDSPGRTAAQQEMAEYFFAMIERRRRDPGEDLISRLLAAQVDGEHLSVMELLGFCALLLVAGNETTTNLLGNAVLTFAEWPGTIDRLRAESGALPSAIEEVLRFRSPVQSMFRVTTQDTVVGGTAIPAGSRLAAWIGSANRDGRQFPDPDAFTLERHPNRHLAFGQGIHFCLGAPLARLEARVALSALLARLPGLSLAPGAPLERIDSTIIFGPRQLPVHWQPA